MNKLKLFAAMVEIRACEEQLSDLVESGEVRTPCHLYIGQEAVAAGVCANLTADDTIWGNHRSHGHFLAKGGSLHGLFAEILGKKTGCAGGRGGSMHLVDPDQGIPGTVPIVAGTIPLSVGAGLTAKLNGAQTLSVAFFGDGAVEEGVVTESMNLAALYDVATLFVCENNLYSSHMHLNERRRKDNIPDLATAAGIPTVVVDGNDALAVQRESARIVDQMRVQPGPFFLECRTFRWKGHVGHREDLDVGVLRRGELQEWKGKDPIARLRQHLLDEGIQAEELDAQVAAIEAKVLEALTLARADPFPDPAAVTDHVFAKEVEA